MDTATLRADPVTPTAGAQPDIAFDIGWDHAHHGCVPPPEHLHPLSPVRQGWEAGRAAFGGRTLAPTRQTRTWLQLRLGAWLRGRTFELTQVNPALLRQIEVARCPITREPLSRGSGGPLDASIDRVNDDAGYALGNLAVMSTRAKRAKGRRGVDESLALAQRCAADGPQRIDGLDAAQWQRVAVLSSFATPLPHAQAAALPLVVLPPHRLQVLNPVQALQVILSLQFTRAGHARHCATLAALLPSAEARHAFHAFMHTLLARRLAAGRLIDASDERHAVEDLWRDTLVVRRWQRLALRLGEADCERVCEIAVQRGLAGPALRWRPTLLACEGWALCTSGFVATAEGAPAAGPVALAAVPGAPRRYACDPTAPRGQRPVRPALPGPETPLEQG